MEYTLEFKEINNDLTINSTEIENDSVFNLKEILNNVNYSFTTEACTAYKTLGLLKNITMGDLKTMKLHDLYYIQN